MTEQELPDLPTPWRFKVTVYTPDGSVYQQSIAFDEHSLNEEISFPIPGISKKITARLTGINNKNREH